MFSIYRLLGRFFPKNIKKNIVSLLLYSNLKVEINRFMGFQLIFTALMSAVAAIYFLILLGYNFWAVYILSFITIQAFIYLWLVLSADKKASFIELLLPDALQIMSSNLRAGVTIDKALFMAARPEFGPLKDELDITGKEIAIGKDISKALDDLSMRVKSAKLCHTIFLIKTGIKSGGKIAPLLERTAERLRDEEIMGKKIRASMGMYRILIFIAIGIASPFLFGLSSLVVEVLTTTFSSVSVPNVSSMPITFGGETLAIDFLILFSAVFIATNCILGSIVLGLISKGKAKEGVQYIFILLVLSMATFFIIRKLMFSTLSGMFGA